MILVSIVVFINHGSMSCPFPHDAYMPVMISYAGSVVAVIAIGDEIEIEFHPHLNVTGLVLSIPLWYHMVLTVLP